MGDSLPMRVHTDSNSPDICVSSRETFSEGTLAVGNRQTILQALYHNSQ